MSLQDTLPAISLTKQKLHDLNCQWFFLPMNLGPPKHFHNTYKQFMDVMNGLRDQLPDSRRIKRIFIRSWMLWSFLISSQYILNDIWLYFDCSEQYLLKLQPFQLVYQVVFMHPVIFSFLYSGLQVVFVFAYCKYCAAVSNHLHTMLCCTLCSSRREVGEREQRIKSVQN